MWSPGLSQRFPCTPADPDGDPEDNRDESQLSDFHAEQSAYDRFSEGFETADLKTAKALLNSLR
jgi:hypothetical protein